MTPKQQGEYDVMVTFMNHLLPQMYIIIDDLLDHAPDAPKELVTRAKKFLPAYCPHSFQQSKK